MAREDVVPAIGRVTQLINASIGVPLFEHSHSRRNRFVARVGITPDAFGDFLDTNGFEETPLSEWKDKLSGEITEYSWRKVLDDSRQLHVLFYDGSEIDFAKPNSVYVYAYCEYRWDAHPIKQYKGVDTEDKEGVTQVRKMLEDYGYNYDYTQP